MRILAHRVDDVPIAAVIDKGCVNVPCCLQNLDKVCQCLTGSTSNFDVVFDDLPGLVAHVPGVLDVSWRSGFFLAQHVSVALEVGAEVQVADSHVIREEISALNGSIPASPWPTAPCCSSGDPRGANPK